MVKFKKYYQMMISDNKTLFDDFETVCHNCFLDPSKYEEEFNKIGKKVLEAVREYENRLCADTERGKYIKYSSGLAEKFQEEVRKNFPSIDKVGIVSDSFKIKKINL